MRFPQFENKHQFDALISPQRSFDYQKSIGRVPEGSCPERVIFCYQDSFIQRIAENYRGHWSAGAFRRLYWLDDFPGFAIGNFGIGAPRVVVSMEMLIAWGVKHFVSIGTAGAIAADLKIGELVGCNRAIRDEGTSHHYLPVDRYSYPTDKGQFSKKFQRVGTSWTLDAFFRHTREEITAYQQEGVLTVEMEASALFAVGQLRGVSVGAGFVISDLLYEEEWAPHFLQDPVEKGLDKLLLFALEL